MKAFLILGVALIVTGAAILGYDHYGYTTAGQALQIGPITVTAGKTHKVWLPPVLGWLLLAGGASALASAALSRNN